MPSIAHIAAKILLDTKCVLFNARELFTYTSGRRGPVYVDCRRLISFPAERKVLMDLGAEIIREKCPGTAYIAGGETAGIPYAAFIADRLALPMLYVRKQPKGFGRLAQIEGALEEQGKKTVLVEDMQTDGGSKKVFIDALREAGAVVEHTFVIFHYGIFAQSEKNMAAMNVKLHALCTWWDVLEVARRENHFDAATLDAVEQYLQISSQAE